MTSTSTRQVRDRIHEPRSPTPPPVFLEPRPKQPHEGVVLRPIPLDFLPSWARTHTRHRPESRSPSPPPIFMKRETRKRAHACEAAKTIHEPARSIIAETGPVTTAKVVFASDSTMARTIPASAHLTMLLPPTPDVRDGSRFGPVAHKRRRLSVQGLGPKSAHNGSQKPHQTSPMPAPGLSLPHASIPEVESSDGMADLTSQSNISLLKRRQQENSGHYTGRGASCTPSSQCDTSGDHSVIELPPLTVSSGLTTQPSVRLAHTSSPGPTTPNARAHSSSRTSVATRKRHYQEGPQHRGSGRDCTILSTQRNTGNLDNVAEAPPVAVTSDQVILAGGASLNETAAPGNPFATPAPRSEDARADTTFAASAAVLKSYETTADTASKGPLSFSALSDKANGDFVAKPSPAVLTSSHESAPQGDHVLAQLSPHSALPLSSLTTPLPQEASNAASFGTSSARADSCLPSGCRPPKNGQVEQSAACAGSVDHAPPTPFPCTANTGAVSHVSPPPEQVASPVVDLAATDTAATERPLVSESHVLIPSTSSSSHSQDVTVDTSLPLSPITHRGVQPQDTAAHANREHAAILTPDALVVPATGHVATMVPAAPPSVPHSSPVDARTATPPLLNRAPELPEAQDHPAAQDQPEPLVLAALKRFEALDQGAALNQMVVFDQPAALHQPAFPDQGSASDPPLPLPLCVPLDLIAPRALHAPLVPSPPSSPLSDPSVELARDDSHGLDDAGPCVSDEDPVLPETVPNEALHGPSSPFLNAEFMSLLQYTGMLDTDVGVGDVFGSPSAGPSPSLTTRSATSPPSPTPSVHQLPYLQAQSLPYLQAQSSSSAQPVNPVGSKAKGKSRAKGRFVNAPVKRRLRPTTSVVPAVERILPRLAPNSKLQPYGAVRHDLASLSDSLWLLANEESSTDEYAALNLPPIGEDNGGFTTLNRFRQ